MADQNRVKSIENLIEMIAVLRDANGIGVTELAEEVGLSKGPTHGYLATLHDHGYVRKEGTQYYLGLRWLNPGGAVRDRETLFRVAKEEVDNVAEQTGELVALTTPVQGRNMYLYQNAGDKAVTMDSYLGIMLPLHCTASGKSILAHLDESRRSELIGEDALAEVTENTITDPARLEEELARIREQGYATEDQERLQGTRGIGAPILNGEEVVGAIALAGPTTRMHGSRFEADLVETIQNASNVIELNLTYSD